MKNNNLQDSNLQNDNLHEDTQIRRDIMFLVLKTFIPELREKILYYYRNLMPESVCVKNDGSLVSTCDREVERYLKEAVERYFNKPNPELQNSELQNLESHIVYGEEEEWENIANNNTKNKFCWVVDPIDGTSSFVSGRPLFMLLISVFRISYSDNTKDPKYEPIISFSYQPVLDELYIGNATCDDFTKLIPVSDFEEFNIRINKSNQVERNQITNKEPETEIDNKGIRLGRGADLGRGVDLGQKFGLLIKRASSACYYSLLQASISKITTSSSCLTLADVSLATTDTNLLGSFSGTLFDFVAKRSRSVVYGGDSYNYCMLSLGLIGVVIESGLKIYDIASLVILIKSCGGVILNEKGKDFEFDIFSQKKEYTIIACASRILANEIANSGMFKN